MGIFKFNGATLLLQKLQQPLANIGRFLSFFPCGIITLKAIFSHFHNYLFKIYKCINPHFEKPDRVLFQQYRCTPLFLHLNQWQIANETESLIRLHYAQIKRNPE
jgi:hypothetical protein